MESPMSTLAVLLAVFAVVAATVFLFVLPNTLWKRSAITSTGRSRRRHRNPSTLIIAGPPNAGKTALLLRLCFSSSDKPPYATVTSLEPNTAVLKVSNETSDDDAMDVNIVDVPGHPRLRYLVDDHLSTDARAVVFAVDSTAVATNAAERRAAAEQLYDILAHRDSVVDRIPVCVACTKQDVLSAQPPERIRSLFETELDRIRNARKAALAGHNTAFGKDSAIGEFDDDAGEEKMLIGKPAEDKMPFKLEHLANDVVFVACASGTPQSSIATIAGMASSNSVSDVRQWITNVYLSKKQ